MALVAVGEVHADVAEPGGAEQGIGHRVGEDVGIGVAVEAALGAYDGALLVVSHDRDFLAAIGVTRELSLDAPPART